MQNMNTSLILARYIVQISDHFGFDNFTFGHDVVFCLGDKSSKLQGNYIVLPFQQTILFLMKTDSMDS